MNKSALKIGKRLIKVDRFAYISSTLSQNVHIYNEVNFRLESISSTFCRLHQNVWKWHHYSDQAESISFSAALYITPCI
ncbi:hypothetical protein DPMN_160068 [Dreissena polymorpha]|uniref:Uncharacterized protein n=1 Tax=Dreissena polymorpha TaxID=45954 RepID=A0A9D4EPF9_DREPO|nr:hypothetical protein DPMN_160068 [Dreissena polymorpha]